MEGPYPASLTFERPADQDMRLGRVYLLEGTRGHSWVRYLGRDLDQNFMFEGRAGRLTVTAAGSLQVALVPVGKIPQEWR
jgi:hypothetical protein